MTFFSRNKKNYFTSAAKIPSAVLSLTLLFTLAGCEATDASPDSKPTDIPTITEAASEGAAATAEAAASQESTLILEGLEETASLLSVSNPLGFSISYDEAYFDYLDQSDKNYASFTSLSGDPANNAYLSVSVSDYSLEDTVAGLLLQNDGTQSETTLGKDSSAAVLISCPAQGNVCSPREFYLVEANEKIYQIELGFCPGIPEETLVPRLRLMLDTISFE